MLNATTKTQKKIIFFAFFGDSKKFSLFAKRKNILISPESLILRCSHFTSEWTRQVWECLIHPSRFSPIHHLYFFGIHPSIHRHIHRWLSIRRSLIHPICISRIYIIIYKMTDKQIKMFLSCRCKTLSYLRSFLFLYKLIHGTLTFLSSNYAFVGAAPFFASLLFGTFRFWSPPPPKIPHFLYIGVFGVADHESDIRF